jgi:hypothetical protein
MGQFEQVRINRRQIEQVLFACLGAGDRDRFSHTSQIFDISSDRQPKLRNLSNGVAFRFIERSSVIKFPRASAKVEQGMVRPIHLQCWCLSDRRRRRRLDERAAEASEGPPQPSSDAEPMVVRRISVNEGSQRHDGVSTVNVNVATPIPPRRLNSPHRWHVSSHLPSVALMPSHTAATKPVTITVMIALNA